MKGLFSKKPVPKATDRFGVSLKSDVIDWFVLGRCWAVAGPLGGK